jgi:hypothetical protein
MVALKDQLRRSDSGYQRHFRAIFCPSFRRLPLKIRAIVSNGLRNRSSPRAFLRCNANDAWRSIKLQRV